MRANLFNPWLTLIGVVLLAGTADAGQGPVEARLAAGGKALCPIVTAETASPEVKKLAATLAEYLGRISGATFAVETGDGTAGIAIGTAADFPALKLADSSDPRDVLRAEEYLLRSRPNGLLLIGATGTGVQQGMWDFLHRLGYRQFFPTKTWEIVPNASTLAIAIDELCRPSYAGRVIAMAHGAFTKEINLEEIQWRAKNRVNNIPGVPQWGFGHVYQDLFREYPEEFKNHPEYGLGKQRLCWSQQGLLDLMVKRSLLFLEKHPDAVVVSAEPSDSCQWCKCEQCLKIGTPSDRALYVANAVARAVQDKYPHETRFVGLLAYDQHSSAPTNVKPHPRVLIGVAQGLTTGKLTGLDLVHAWLATGVKQIGIYEYWNVYEWNLDMPGGILLADSSMVASRIRDFHRAGAVYLYGQSSSGFGPCGPGMYVAARVLWDVKEADRVSDLIEDFLTRSFGSAKEPMRAFYRLLDGKQKPLMGENLIGRMYRRLAEARKLTDGPHVCDRLDDLTLYTRYVELMHAAQQNNRSLAAAEPVLRHAYRMDRTPMVSARGLWLNWVSKGIPEATLKDLPPEVNFNSPEGKDPWKSSAPFTREEIDAMSTAGIANNPLVDARQRN